jgi:kexin
MVFYERQALVCSLNILLMSFRGESGIGNWTIHVRDTASLSTGILHSWQLILWGSSIDPSITQPHPLPGTDEPSSTSTSLPQPTISPPHESEQPTKPTSSPSPIPTSGFWPWSSENKMIWIYGSVAGIICFVSLLGVWYAIQKRKARIVETHGRGREDYEFEVLLNQGEMDNVQQPGELYDAFAGGEEYLKSNTRDPSQSRQSPEEISDGEMSGFLRDDENDDDEKGSKTSFDR